MKDQFISIKSDGSEYLSAEMKDDIVYYQVNKMKWTGNTSFMSVNGMQATLTKDGNKFSFSSIRSRYDVQTYNTMPVRGIFEHMSKLSTGDSTTKMINCSGNTMHQAQRLFNEFKEIAPSGLILVVDNSGFKNEPKAIIILDDAAFQYTLSPESFDEVINRYSRGY